MTTVKKFLFQASLIQVSAIPLWNFGHFTDLQICRFTDILNCKLGDLQIFTKSQLRKIAEYVQYMI